MGYARLSYSGSDDNGGIDANTEIISEKNYYPFGLHLKSYNIVVNGTHHSYTFNGKEELEELEELEEQEELGLDLYDFGARNYDASLGRWMSIDPLAEKYQSRSTYHSVYNNPLRDIGPNGMENIVVVGSQNEEGAGKINVCESSHKNIEEMV